MAGKTHPSDWRNAPARTRQLALAALLGIIGGVGLVMHFSGAAARTVGPTLIARNAAGETLLANGGTLFLVNADESQTLSLPVAELGLRGPVMSVSSDGKDWYLGDDATAMLYRCDPRARHCTAALQPQPDTRIFRRAHHVAFTTDRIFMTDSEAHRVLMFDREGGVLDATRTSPLALCFPNGIVAVDGHVYVADTNNFRIARLPVATPRQSEALLHTNAGAAVERANCNARSAASNRRGSPVLNTAIDSANTIKREARPPARPDRVWPASVLHTSTNEWWVIQMANRMRDGDVIRYDAGGRPLGRIELPPDADPIDLVEARGRVLITDAGLTRVHRVSLQGTTSAAWGPTDFRAQLGAIAAERDFQRSLQYLSFGVIGAGVLASMFVVVLELRRQRAEKWSSHGRLRPVDVRPAALGHETVWLPIDVDVARRARRMVWALGAYAIVMFVVLLYLARELRLDTAMGRFHAFMIGVMVILLLLALVAGAIGWGRLARRRIGVTRTELWFDPGSGDVTRSRWEDVRATARGVLIGRHLVDVVDQRGRYTYPQADVESQVLSRLSATAFLSDWRALLEMLRRGNVAVWSGATVVMLYLALTVIRWQQPEWVHRAGRQFVELFR